MEPLLNVISMHIVQCTLYSCIVFRVITIGHRLLKYQRILVGK